MEYFVIGTAGHVDHGKTELVKALTGVDTDPLKEEKERGISIDLGFAPFRLPGGQVAGIVDVPGHERFINNMLAGVGGIDLVLFIIDVMEGIMPQTREHLQILNLLDLKKGIVILTKVDLVEDEWVEMVKEEVRDALKNTFLEGAPVCAVSALTGQGLDHLLESIELVAAQVKSKEVSGPLRLPVDRSFSVPGFGTVVTGTLLSGRIEIEQTVEVLPSGSKVRVRRLQVHGKNVETALAGQRVAVNLAAFDRGNLNRGGVVATPGYFRVVKRADVRLNLLKEAPRPLCFFEPVHFYLGTAKVVARVALLDQELLLPGESSIVQLRFESPLVVHRGDRFIIRSYSPVTTIGGGCVIDPEPPRHKRFCKSVMTILEQMEGDDYYFVLQKIASRIIDYKELAKVVGLGEEQLSSLIVKLEKDDKIVSLDKTYISTDCFTEYTKILIKELKSFHANNLLISGISRASLKGYLPEHLPLKAYDCLLNKLVVAGLISLEANMVSLANFSPQPTVEQAEILKRIESIYLDACFQPPSPVELAETLNLAKGRVEMLLSYLENCGKLHRITEDIFFHKESYQKALELLTDHFALNESLTLADFRDRLNSSRKYVQPLLEFFDQLKYTRRIGDKREAWKLPGVKR